MPIWETHYDRHTVPILKRKRTADLLNFLAGLAVYGPGTTTEIANFVKHKEENSIEFHYSSTYVREKQGVFFNLVRDRPKANSNEKYIGLESAGFVKKGYKINEKNKRVPLYALTLKGCFFAMGYDFEGKDLCRFIENAAKNHLYFAYLDSLIQKLPFSFVREIFLDSFQELIKSGRILLDGPVNFYIPNLTHIAITIFQRKIGKVTNEWHMADPGGRKDIEWEDFEGSKNIVTLIDNTLSGSIVTDEGKAIILHYYPEKNTEKFYLEYSDDRLTEQNFLSIGNEFHRMYSSEMYGI